MMHVSHAFLGRAPKGKMPFHGITALVILLLLATIAGSIPTPLGIDGAIYELDGLTQVPKGIPFSVTNLATGKVVQGTTGYGSSGGYAASLTGTSGNILLVRAWNKYNAANTTVALLGVMHNVNFVLNMTYPPLAPNITTLTIPAAVEDEPYEAQLEVIDENNDPLAILIYDAPPGLGIDSSHKISWMPSDDVVGMHTLSFGVSDGVFITNATFSLEVVNVNDAPEIISFPVEEAMEDFPYHYQVDAQDIDDAHLWYSLAHSPNGMAINAFGRITWLPQNEDVGPHTIVVQVSDGEFSAVQNFTLSVENTNDAPQFISLPLTSATEDYLYAYQPIVTDLDSSIIQFSLVEAPNTMGINSSGAISWIPHQQDIGIHRIVIAASDDENASLQSFALSVANVNDAPVVLSVPPATVAATENYAYQMHAVDEDNDTLAFLIVHAPENAYLNSASGYLSWKPAPHQEGLNAFALLVADGSVNISHTFNVTVLKKNQPPSPPSKGSGGRGSGGGSGGKGATGSAVKDIIEKKQQGAIPEYILSLMPQLNLSQAAVYPNETVTIDILPHRPDGASQLPNKVYKYLKIEQESPLQEEPIIIFKVEKLWLENSRLLPEDVILAHFADGKWETLETARISEDEHSVYYLSSTPSFSYFAIAAREGVDADYNFVPSVSRIKLPYSIAGIIYTFGKWKEANEKTRVIITNMDTSERIVVETGIGPHSGAYAATISGMEGHTISVQVGPTVEHFTLASDDLYMVNFMKSLLGEGYTPIHRDPFLGSPLVSSALLLAALSALGMLIFNRMHSRRKIQ